MNYLDYFLNIYYSIIIIMKGLIILNNNTFNICISTHCKNYNYCKRAQSTYNTLVCGINYHDMGSGSISPSIVTIEYKCGPHSNYAMFVPMDDYLNNERTDNNMIDYDKFSCCSKHCEKYDYCTRAHARHNDTPILSYYDLTIPNPYSFRLPDMYVCGPNTNYELFIKADNHLTEESIINAKLPYTRTDDNANKIITAIIESFNSLVSMAKLMGYDIKLTPNSEEPLCLYYHDDYPGIILVDKEELSL